MQHLFNGEPASDKAQLDANFSELYGRIITTSFKGSAGVDQVPAVLGVNLIGNVGAGGGYAVGLGLNMSFDGTNYRTGTDGGSNGGGMITATYGDGAMRFYTVASTGGTSQTIAPGSLALRMALTASGALVPGADNTQPNGAAAFRWSTIYAGTGTINTSDAREKTAVAPLSEAEIAAAQDMVASIGTYQWLEAIQVKGAGDARKHVGMTVQQAISVMTAHGLDPMAYGFICYDSWPEEKDESDVVTLEAGDRYSFRPDELGMFIARGVAARLAAIEARLAAAGIA